MAMTEYAGTTNYIAQLDDLPNDEGGLTADELKAKFDQALTEFVEWFNDTHKTQFDALPTTADLAAKAAVADLTAVRHRQYLGV